VRNPDPKPNQDRMDPVHKAQDVGKKVEINVQNLDVVAWVNTFILVQNFV